MVVFWIIIFIVALAAVVKGSDWLLEGSERIGLALGMSPFIVGVLIVGFGTSFPELISSMVATFRGVTEIVVANAIGSNIANIFLVIGLSVVIARRLTVSKSLINLDIPLLAISTVLLLGIVWDKQVTFFESILLLGSYVIYLLYAVLHKEDEESEAYLVEVLPLRQEKRRHIVLSKKNKISRPKLQIKDFFVLVLGIIVLAIGAKYLIDAVIRLSEILNISPGVISITAVAFGTSLPELIVSLKAAFAKKSELALGNIFGSNIFNALVVVGLPGLFRTLVVDEKTFLIGVPAVAIATTLFVISGISRRIYIWEGALFLVIYIFFISKLFL